MKQHPLRRAVHRVDVQVSALTSALLVVSCWALLLVQSALGETPALFFRLVPWLLVGFCLVSSLCAVFCFRHLSNPFLQDMATTDYLTELKNRNYFDVVLGNLEPRNTRNMGMILIDLNDLKAVNDTLGHAYGDRYLRRVADVLRKVQSDGCTAYRIGGDEFVLLCPGTTERALQDLCETLCRAYEATRPGWPVVTSFSTGWALFDPTRDMNAEDTLRRADAEMYLCKWRFHGEHPDTKPFTPP